MMNWMLEIVSLSCLINGHTGYVATNCPPLPKKKNLHYAELNHFTAPCWTSQVDSRQPSFLPRFLGSLRLGFLWSHWLLYFVLSAELKSTARNAAWRRSSWWMNHYEFLAISTDHYGLHQQLLTGWFKGITMGLHEKYPGNPYKWW